MREFAFTVDYEQGADPVMDVFIEYPEAYARTVQCNVTPGAMWRLDRIAGPMEALDQLTDVYTDPAHCNECLGGRHCHTDWEYEVLARDAERTSIYTYRPRGDCISVPRAGACILGDGVLYEAERRESAYEWRLLVPDDAPIGEVYEVLAADLRDDLTLSFEQVNDPSHWINEIVSLAEFPYEQHAALGAAVEHGYYEVPRELSLNDLAEEFEIPRSTLQYQLQRAESRLISCFVRDDGFIRDGAWG